MKKFLSVLFIVLLLGSCQGENPDKPLYDPALDKNYRVYEHVLPPGSYDIEHISRNWAYFSFDERRYIIYHQSGFAGNTTIECID
jgi:hypothetical protein